MDLSNFYEVSKEIRKYDYSIGNHQNNKNMERFVWKVGDNETGNKWTVYVRATLADMQRRLYIGGIMQFLACPFDKSKNVPKGSLIEGKKVMSISEFDTFAHNERMW